MSEDDYIVSCVRQYYRLLAQAASDTNNSQTHIQISICLLRRMRELFADKAAIHKALLQVITHELCTDTQSMHDNAAQHNALGYSAQGRNKSPKEKLASEALLPKLTVLWQQFLHRIVILALNSQLVQDGAMEQLQNSPILCSQSLASLAKKIQVQLIFTSGQSISSLLIQHLEQISVFVDSLDFYEKLARLCCYLNLYAVQEWIYTRIRDIRELWKCKQQEQSIKLQDHPMQDHPMQEHTMQEHPMNHINTLKHIETSSLEEYSDDNGISEQPLTASKNPQDREKIERENLKEENKRKKIRDIRKIKEKGKHSETKDVLQDQKTSCQKKERGYEKKKTKAAEKSKEGFVEHRETRLARTELKKENKELFSAEVAQRQRRSLPRTLYHTRKSVHKSSRKSCGRQKQQIYYFEQTQQQMTKTIETNTITTKNNIFPCAYHKKESFAQYTPRRTVPTNSLLLEDNQEAENSKILVVGTPPKPARC